MKKNNICFLVESWTFLRTQYVWRHKRSTRNVFILNQTVSLPTALTGYECYQMIETLFLKALAIADEETTTTQPSKAADTGRDRCSPRCKQVILDQFSFFSATYLPSNRCLRKSNKAFCIMSVTSYPLSEGPIRTTGRIVGTTS